MIYSKNIWLNILGVILKTIFCVWFLGYISFCILTNDPKWITSFLEKVCSFISAPQQDDMQNKPLLIVVLTGDSGRMERGIEALKNNPSSFLFVSGVNKDLSLEKLLDLYHVDVTPLKGRIEIGYIAHNTQQNASETARWIEKSIVMNNEQEKIAIVTSTYHIMRSVLEFHHVLKDRRIIPVPVVSHSRGVFIIRYLHFLRFNFWEYNKILIMPLRWNM